MKNVKCENYLCVYFYKGLCRLENITISAGGICNSCIYIDIDENYLNRQRDKTLKALENF